LWQIPQTSTFTRTCPGPGSGISPSTNSKSPPALPTWAAFIIPTDTLFVAIQPSARFRNGILPVLRLTDKDQIRLRLSDHTQPFAKHRVVIDQQYPYRFRWWHIAPRYISLTRPTVNDSTAH